MKLSHEVLTVHTRHPFTIARGTTTQTRVVTVRVTDEDGAEGWGEAAPNRFYGETVETAVAALEYLRPVVEKADPWAIETIEAEMNRAIRFNGSVKSAVSAALHDMAGRRLGVP